jgi:hypothetical protein
MTLLRLGIFHIVSVEVPDWSYLLQVQTQLELETASLAEGPYINFLFKRCTSLHCTCIESVLESNGQATHGSKRSTRQRQRKQRQVHLFRRLYNGHISNPAIASKGSYR